MTTIDPTYDITTSTTENPLVATLPGKTYCDPQEFEQEQKNIFGREWMCAIRLDDLVNVGDYKKVFIAGEDILIVKGRDQQIRAFYNVCRHRGSALCTENFGNMPRSIQCPYHAWTYGLDGKLITAPNMASLGQIDRTEYGLSPIATREWLGYLWICLNPIPPNFEESVMGAVSERLGDNKAIDYYHIDELAIVHRKRYEVDANWKLIIENFMECYHCATIHPELTEVLPEFTLGLAAQVFVGHGAEFGKDIDGFTVDGSAGHATLKGLPEERDRKYFAITIRPTVFINLVPDHVIIHRMFPMSVDRTMVICDWLTEPESLTEDFSGAVELFDRVNTQDFYACEITQPGMASRSYAQGGTLVPAEHHILDFHDWVLKRLSSDSEVNSGVNRV